MAGRRAARGIALALAGALAACAGQPDDSEKENALLALNAEDIRCPPARLLADTDHFTGIIPASETGGDPVAYDADLVLAESACRREKDHWIISVRLKATAGAIGSAVATGVRLPVFLALTEYERTVLDKKLVEIPVRFVPNDPRIALEQTIEGLGAPATGLHPGPGYEILVGFQLTPEQLERNRRGRQRLD